MHEASLLRQLMHKIEAVAAENRARKVTKVEVSLGALSHFTEEHFREHFDESSRGTVAEGAVLRVNCLSDIHHPLAQEVILESVDVV